MDTVIVSSKKTGSFPHLARLSPKGGLYFWHFNWSAKPRISELMSGKEN